MDTAYLLILTNKNDKPVFSDMWYPKNGKANDSYYSKLILNSVLFPSGGSYEDSAGMIEVLMQEITNVLIIRTDSSIANKVFKRINNIWMDTSYEPELEDIIEVADILNAGESLGRVETLICQDILKDSKCLY